MKANANLQQHRKARALLGADATPAAASQRLPVSTALPSSSEVAPWDADPGPKSSSQPLLGSFYPDDSEHLAQPSPPFRPSSGRTGTSDSPDTAFDTDARRPSVISATSVSSQASKNSAGGKFHKSLKNWLGDDPSDPKIDPATIAAQAAPPQPAQAPSEIAKSNIKNRLRNDSVATSDTSDRPNTPLVPSSDVTPWMYQNFDVSIALVVSMLICCCVRTAGFTRNLSMARPRDSKRETACLAPASGSNQCKFLSRSQHSLFRSMCFC